MIFKGKYYKINYIYKLFLFCLSVSNIGKGKLDIKCLYKVLNFNDIDLEMGRVSNASSCIKP